MKRKFNFYCLLLLGAVALSLCSAAQSFVEGFSSGLTDAAIESQYGAGDNQYEPYTLNLHSDNPARRDLALYDTQSHRIDSLRVSKATVWIPAKPSDGTRLPLLLGATAVLLAVLGCFIAFWVIFVKLVLAVNRGADFGHAITQCLRWMGRLLIAMYAGEWASWAISLPPALSYQGYTVTSTADCDHMLLVSGIGLLVISQLFAVGQRMKEENELTI